MRRTHLGMIAAVSLASIGTVKPESEEEYARRHKTPPPAPPLPVRQISAFERELIAKAEAKRARRATRIALSLARGED